MNQKLFHVRWEIDLVASDPTDAARQALAIHRDPESISTFFEVRRRRLDGTKGKWHLIDLTYGPATFRTPDNVCASPCASDPEAAFDAEAEAYSDAAAADAEARTLREGPYAPRTAVVTQIIDGVRYEQVPETLEYSCKGCAAYGNALCGKLAPDESSCYEQHVIWVVSESKPEPEPAPEPAPPPSPTERPRREDDFHVVDGVVYERTAEEVGESCEGCVAYGAPLCDTLSGTCFARGTIWKLAGENATVVDGKLYKAVENDDCTGCAFNDAYKRTGCPPPHTLCSRDLRDDQHSVIWVEVQK